MGTSFGIVNFWLSLNIFPKTKVSTLFSDSFYFTFKGKDSGTNTINQPPPPLTLNGHLEEWSLSYFIK